LPIILLAMKGGKDSYFATLCFYFMLSVSSDMAAFLG
jgi:hypothetical protein